MPVLMAFALGLIVALHPCLLATNIAAMGYMAGSAAGGKSVLVRSMAYIAGRVVAYSLLGVLLATAARRGIDLLAVGGKAGEWGERISGVALIAIGVCLLALFLMHKEGHCHTAGRGKKWAQGVGGSFLLGMALALSFCPESAVVFFGIVIPMSSDAAAAWALPVMFAVGTSVPAVMLAWCFAFGVVGVASMRGRMQRAQRWVSGIVALLFIIAGLVCLFV